MRRIEDWQRLVLSTKSAAIEAPWKGGNASHLLVTDASAQYWAGVQVGGSRIATAIGGRSTVSKHSSITEPWAVYKAIMALHGPEDKGAIVLMTDNAATVGAFANGFSAAWHLNRVLLLLREKRPLLRVHAIHLKGESNLADALSRGQAATSEHINKFIEELNTYTDSSVNREVRNIAEPLRGVPSIPFRIGVHHLGNT
jgi:hypothetical protein